MNLEAIPKTFWHTLSFCLLFTTLGLTLIAYKAENFSIKYNEIELLSSGNQALKAQLDQQAENILRQSQVLNQRRAEIERLRTLSESRLNELIEAQNLIAELESEIMANSKNPGDKIGRKVKTINQTIQKELKKSNEIDDSIATLKTLDIILQQQQEAQYQQQQQILQQQEIQRQIQQQFKSKY